MCFSVCFYKAAYAGEKFVTLRIKRRISSSD